MRKLIERNTSLHRLSPWEKDRWAWCDLSVPPCSSCQHCWGTWIRIPVPLRLTDDIGLVLGICPHFPLVLGVLLAVPPVGLLADLLPALLVDALHISDGGSARSEKQNFQFSCWQLSHHTPPFPSLPPLLHPNPNFCFWVLPGGCQPLRGAISETQSAMCPEAAGRGFARKH